MAYFIVIGTDNSVINVVDEIKNSHLQHNVVTAGCVHEEAGNLFYKWTVYNQQGKETNKDNGEKSNFSDLLTNQISQFKSLLPPYQSVHIFVVSQCITEEQCESLRFVCENLYNIGGATLSSVSVDIVLIGYNPSRSADVTNRPSWRSLKDTLGIGANSSFLTNVLYMNNMDFNGAATNVDSKLLARFLCHWSKMVSSGGSNMKTGVTRDYCIGMAEYQYCFEDIADFFKLAAEERILDRTLNDAPSSATEEMCKLGYYKFIDLSKPWIDGLNTIKGRWEQYCATEYDYSKSVGDQGYTLESQKKVVVEYLNGYLRIYCDQLRNRLKEKEDEKLEIETEIEEKNGKLLVKKELLPKEDGVEESPELEQLKSEIEEIENVIKELDSKLFQVNADIRELERNIDKNTFDDTTVIFEKYNPNNILTPEDKADYERARKSENSLCTYLGTPDAVNVIRKTIFEAEDSTEFPKYPKDTIASIGKLTPVVSSPSIVTPIPPNPLEERKGCIGGIVKWWKGLFGGNEIEQEDTFTSQVPVGPSSTISQMSENEKITNAFKALKDIEEVEHWWQALSELVQKKTDRLNECLLLMDGEKNVNGKYLAGKEGYVPKDHHKSHTLIDMDMVRSFRDGNGYYLEMIARMKDKWFDSTIELSKRQTMQELIKHQVIDALRGQYHTLHWDNKHPFVDEERTYNELSKIINDTSNQSNFFAEYVDLRTDALSSRINPLFYFNDSRIKTNPVDFRSEYHVGEGALTPCYLEDFVNSLCTTQVIALDSPVKELKDFKPKREYKYPKQPGRNYQQDALTITGDANEPVDKARKIYDWLCDNISYDTTMTIHDADTAWVQKRGVCQAYCELFCILGEAVGLSVEIVCGKSKSAEGKVSEKGHSWIYVFTDGYDGILIDPTWGAGGIDDGGKFHQSNSADRETWFDVDPAWMIYTHFPDGDYWQLQNPNGISLEQFEKLPVRYPQADENATIVFQLDYNNL